MIVGILSGWLSNNEWKDGSKTWLFEASEKWIHTLEKLTLSVIYVYIMKYGTHPLLEINIDWLIDRLIDWIIA